MIAAVLFAAAPVFADEVAFVRGGPKSAAAKADAISALADARRDMMPCWRRGATAVEIAVTTDAGGAVTSAAPRTDGPSAQCVAGILAVATLPRSAGAWSGVVTIGPGNAGGGGGGGGGSNDDVGAALGAHGAELRACQKADGKASGVVEIDLRVHADGTITDIAVAKSLSTALDACLVKALGRLRLDAYHGKEVRYRLGLQYAGSGDAAPPSAPAPTPTAAPIKRGPLDVDQMMPVIEADRAHIDRCGAGVKKSGKLVVRFTIRKDGTVKNLGVKESLGDPAVEKCVLDRFGGLRFPPASDETQVQFPLAFTAT